MCAAVMTLLERCKRIGTSTWSDALDNLAINGVVRGISHRSGQGRFAAFAVTARQATGGFGVFQSSDFSVAQIVGAAGPDKVLVVDMGGAEISTFGGLAALAAVTRGVAAVVIDGACRDLDEIRTHGLWLASRSVTPTSGKRRVKLKSLGEPVNIGGITVRPDDLVVGDETGIVSVPKDDIERVLVDAERLHSLDEQIEAALKQGQSFEAAIAAADYV